MTARDYHLLDPDSIRGDNLLWWRPDSQGYTTEIGEAGLYTEAEARNVEAIAVHRDQAASASIMTVALGRLRKTGALDEHYLRQEVERAWHGPRCNSYDATVRLDWPEVLADRVSNWHYHERLTHAEWARVAETVRADEPGRYDVRCPDVKVTLGEWDAQDGTAAHIARATIGKIELSEIAADRKAASEKLVDAARARGRIERGESGNIPTSSRLAGDHA